MRNLALVVVPAVAMGALALALAGRVDRDVAAAALALAVVPAPLLGPELVGRMRGRADLAGALVLGTVVLSVIVAATRGALATAPVTAAVAAYALAATVAGAVPTVRDAILTPLRWLGWIAAATVLAAVGTSIPRLDALVVVVALAMLGAGALVAAAIALLSRRDVRAAVGGAGLRDPVLATALLADPRAAGVALAYTAFCLVLAAFALRRR